MTLSSVLAQSSSTQTTTGAPDSSSAAAAIFGVFLLVGILSLFALSKRGRRTLGPLVAILLGASIIASTVAAGRASAGTFFSPLTLIGLFVGLLIVVGGFGALREGITVPEVEGVEPDSRGRLRSVTPDDE